MAAAGAAVAAAIANAAKASGVIVRVNPQDFLSIVRKADKPLIVYATGGFFSTNHHYLTSYKGLAFYAKSPSPVELPSDAELVLAEKFWMPG